MRRIGSWTNNDDSDKLLIVLHVSYCLTGIAVKVALSVLLWLCLELIEKNAIKVYKCLFIAWICFKLGSLENCPIDNNKCNMICA